VLPTLGDTALADLSARDLLGLRTELRHRGLSLKFVKNIIAGSLKAMLRDARIIDHKLDHDPFLGVKWPRVEVPSPTPFTAEERYRILGWFRDKHFGFHPGTGTVGLRWRPHPPYHAYVHLLFWTGMRPSEAAGLRWSDVDLGGGGLEVRRSRHLYEDSATKIERAQRHVELLPETVRMVAAIQPVRVAPAMPVFVNTVGRPLEPRAFLPHWYACLRALGIRSRGIYSCKDTYLSTVLPLKPIPWIEEQTGVVYATLKKHYAKMAAAPHRRRGVARARSARARRESGQFVTPGNKSGARRNRRSLRRDAQIVVGGGMPRRGIEPLSPSGRAILRSPSSSTAQEVGDLRRPA
jgi:integrase